MSHQHQGQEAPVFAEARDAEAPFITDCHRNAVDSLASAYTNGRPLAVLIGDGRCGAAFVVNRFVAGIKDDLAFVRISEPSSTAVGMMRQIVSGIGFDPKAMSLTDLEQIFKMFLVFQLTHNRRTIICIEKTQDNGQWVLDRIRRLVEMEEKGKFGLMVIISGNRALQELLSEPPLNAIGSSGAKRITLAPFTPAETKEYIRRRVEGTGGTDIDHVFTFNAITVIQELSAGIPDEISKLCSKCLELADLDDSGPINAALVNRAAKLLRLASIVQEPNTVLEDVAATAEESSEARLVAYVNDTLAKEQVLNGSHVLIGRDDLCDIRLSNRIVSRHHALVVNSSMGIKLVDLGSRNGTYVNGKKIRKHTLQDSDKITVGDCSIEFVAGDDHHSWYFDSDPTDVLEPQIVRRSLAGLGNGFEMESIESTKAMISSRHLGARN